ncbi:hypothetical protein Anas_13348 [Armadillidium nasatum]|uniref:KilA-N domain-containing protein n=1 Tax=Armadillidium nasatum TaxID=96803 RepID=A0A5N5T392_9CRUS|nr:hypothetical protein Anas_13348 [Armadillidium nasatum]
MELFKYFKRINKRNDMDFNKLITKKIKDTFYYIQYDEFELILNKENNYIKATKLCQLGNVNHKTFKRWNSLNTSKELIKEVKRFNVILEGENSRPPRLLITIDLCGKYKPDSLI